VRCNAEAYVAHTMSPPYSTLWLSRHVHVCKLNSTIVVLDVARDRYLSLRGSTVQTLAAIVPGWPESNDDEPLNDRCPSADTSRSIGHLIAQGVFTPREADGKAATPTQIDSRTASIALNSNVARRRKIRGGDVMNFLLACASTIWLLRCRSLQSAIDALEARKALGGERDFDAVLAADLVAIFRRLRSFTFSAHRRCLFHALVLANFLSRYGVYPHFVMGVKVEPWAAHSWVQSGEYVLDGTPEQVRFFTPILAV
jgi:hypothetical protein